MLRLLTRHMVSKRRGKPPPSGTSLGSAPLSFSPKAVSDSRLFNISHPKSQIATIAIPQETDARIQAGPAPANPARISPAPADAAPTDSPTASEADPAVGLTGR